MIDQHINFEGIHCMCSKDKATKPIRLMDGWMEDWSVGQSTGNWLVGWINRWTTQKHNDTGSNGRGIKT